MNLLYDPVRKRGHEALADEILNGLVNLLAPPVD